MTRMLVVAAFFLVIYAVCAHDDHDHVFGEASDLKDETHIREHMENKIDLPRHLAAAQSRFLYFEMFDLNKDNFIDGIEACIHIILKMMSHSHEKGSSMPGSPVTDEDAMIIRIDKTLNEMDFDGDGLITFSEFCKHQETQENWHPVGGTSEH